MSPNAYQAGDWRDIEVRVHRAAPIGDQHVPTAAILLNAEWPDPAPDVSLEELAARFDLEAGQIADALIQCLPGGTLDRLVGRLLIHKASHFIVNYAPAEQAEGRS